MPVIIEQPDYYEEDKLAQKVSSWISERENNPDTQSGLQIKARYNVRGALDITYVKPGNEKKTFKLFGFSLTAKEAKHDSLGSLYFEKRKDSWLFTLRDKSVLPAIEPMAQSLACDFNATIRIKLL